MSIDKFNKNILKNVDSLKDLGQDIQKNMSGFLDTKIDTLGKTLDTASSFAFGKLKRMKGDLKKITDGVLKFDKSMPAITLNTSGKSSGEELDWRVSLSIPQQIKDIIQDQKSLLDPLKATGNKLVFPYTPTILVGQSASWNPMQPVHTNYPFYAYENSRVDQMTITAHFYVQNEIEARYWVAAVHYLRSMTKMSYGLSPNKGAPPPVVRLNGYGDYTFKDVPVIIQNFTFDLKEDVDYISTRLTAEESGTADGPSSVTSKGGTYAWAPTESLLTIGVVPQYSRTRQAQFDLADFVKNGGTKGSGFI
tara:strand:- start:443 stop:1363 length:921 start_codon:yes stop_codon:yes gene_type:complete